MRIVHSSAILAACFALIATATSAGNTSTNTSNNTSTNKSTDPWSSNSSSNSSSNQSGWQGRVDDYRRESRRDVRGDDCFQRCDYSVREEYRTESGDWFRVRGEPGWRRDGDDN